MANFDQIIDYDPHEEDTKNALWAWSNIANVHDLRLYLVERGIFPVPDKAFWFGAPEDKTKTATILRQIWAPEKIQNALANVA